MISSTEHDSRRKVCVILVDRANYGRMKPVMRAIQIRPELYLQVVVAGTMVLERFDHPVSVVKADGFRIDAEIFLELEGSNPTTMAKSVGFSIIEFAGEFKRLQPDIVVIIGDRYEALAATIAAAYMNICILHIQGGEVSGSIDESARHAISKFSQFHYPSTLRAREYLIRMGESPRTILGVGCPSSDVARVSTASIAPEVVNSRGSGVAIDFRKPFILAVFHPNTTEFGSEHDQMFELLRALEILATQTILLWPNIDAGAEHINKAIRVFRDQSKVRWLRTLINLTPEDYLSLLASAACAVGNSSSFVRDAGFFGTPVVLIGARQTGRESDSHVVQAELRSDKIVETIRAQLEHGRYLASTLYGDGLVSPRIAEALVRLEPYLQKRLNYPPLVQE